MYSPLLVQGSSYIQTLQTNQNLTTEACDQHPLESSAKNSALESHSAGQTVETPLWL